MAKRIIDTDRGMKKILRSLAKLNGKQLTVGIHEEESQRGEGKLSNAEIGTIHEFGAPAANIPERSFLRSTFDEQQRQIKRDLAQGSKDVYKRGSNTGRIFRAGERFRSAVIKKIQGGIAPDTKQGDKALIATGQMLNSIRAKVR